MTLLHDPGWVGVVLKLAVFIVIGAVGMVIEHKMVDWMVHFGAWVERLLTFGRHRPDPDSWFSIIFGFILTIVVATFAAGFFISHQQTPLGGH